MKTMSPSRRQPPRNSASLVARRASVPTPPSSSRNNSPVSAPAFAPASAPASASAPAPAFRVPLSPWLKSPLPPPHPRSPWLKPPLLPVLLAISAALRRQYPPPSAVNIRRPPPSISAAPRRQYPPPPAVNPQYSVLSPFSLHISKALRASSLISTSDGFCLSSGFKTTSLYIKSSSNPIPAASLRSLAK